MPCPFPSPRVSLVLLLVILASFPGYGATRPNILWIVSEDNAKHFSKLFDPNGADMPNVERLAREGVKFTHAFSNMPVCSAARSILATGCYGSRIGTQFHRRPNSALLPEGLKPFHVYLRDAGYFCPHPGKTDYNFQSGPQHGWMDRKTKRREGQPFFRIVNYGTSHEGQLHKPDILTGGFEGSDSVFIPPIHPRTELFKNTYAKYHTLIRKVDEQVGHEIAQLEQQGLLEDTFIFYFGDHGGVCPGSKGYVYETGLHVPLVIRIPKNFQHLVDYQRGETEEGFISFVDFAPTVLRLAGVEVPGEMDGRPFLGPEVNRDDVASRDESFGMADRFDEKYDLVRSLRKGRFKYIRSYQPFNFDALQNNYRYKAPAYREWRELFHAGKLTPEQAAFFLPRAPEALYDLESDPYETRNLAADPQYASTLAQLRARLHEWVSDLPDLSFYPESVLFEEDAGTPAAFGRRKQAEIARLVDIADLQLLPFEAARDRMEDALNSEKVWERYWGLIVCSSHAEAASAFITRAKTLTAATEPALVRVRAAEFLSLVDAVDPRPVLSDVLAQTYNPLEALLALNTVVMLRDGHPRIPFSISPDAVMALHPPPGGIEEQMLRSRMDTLVGTQ